jgi:hypothetical protein
MKQMNEKNGLHNILWDIILKFLKTIVTSTKGVYC